MAWRCFVLISLVCVGLACSKDPEEVALRSLFEQVRLSAEAKNFSGVAAPFTSDYSDTLGTKRSNLESRMKNAFKEYEKLAVKLKIESMEKTGISAKVKTQVRIEGIKGEGKTPIIGSPLGGKRIEFYLEKRLERWWITGATIQR